MLVGFSILDGRADSGLVLRFRPMRSCRTVKSCSVAGKQGNANAKEKEEGEGEGEKKM